MTNMKKDYYKILGVNDNCSMQELKSAYRKLARLWHPDIAGNTPDIVAKFKEINEAYEILSNNSSRESYDTARKFYNYSTSPNEQKDNFSNYYKKNNNKEDFSDLNNKFKETANFNKFGFNWNEIFSKYKNHTSNEKKEFHDKKAHYGNSQKGKDIFTDVEISIGEATNGTTKIINMLHTHSCPRCNGRKFVNGNTCTCCNGKGEISEYKKFTVKIPAGINDKSKIRLSGEGELGTNGGKNGDLYITVNIKSPLDYEIDGINIIKTISLQPYEAVLGTNLSVKTLNGNVNVKIVPNTKNGQKIRLKSCGLNKGNKSGDMILIVAIQIPNNLSDKEIELYKKLQECSKTVVR